MDIRVKKVVLVNLLLFTSFIVVLIYLLFSTFAQLALNKSRDMLGKVSLILFAYNRPNQFSDSFKGFTFFVEKFNNEIKNIFIRYWKLF